MFFHSESEGAITSIHIISNSHDFQSSAGTRNIRSARQAAPPVSSFAAREELQMLQALRLGLNASSSIAGQVVEIVSPPLYTPRLLLVADGSGSNYLAAIHNLSTTCSFLLGDYILIRQPHLLPQSRTADQLFSIPPLIRVYCPLRLLRNGKRLKQGDISLEEVSIQKQPV